MNRQRLLLLILLVLLAVALIWSYTHLPRQKTLSDQNKAPGQHSPPPAARRPTAASSPAVSARPGALRLDLLDRVPMPFKGYYRNLFKPVFVDEIKVMKRRAAALKPALPPIALPVRIVPVQPLVQPEPPKRELARFTFLGFLKKDNRRIIFLTKDKEIILVRKGDIFAGRYEAASITDQALTILVNDTGEEIVIPLIENRLLGSTQ